MAIDNLYNRCLEGT